MIASDSLPMDDFGERETPGFLKVLTVLTFIGSGIQIISALYQFFTAEKTYKEKDIALSSINNPQTPNFVKKLMGTPEEYTTLVTNSFENRIPILLVTLVAAALCIVGAMQMRKLKKQGFLLYTIGEILSVIIPILFIGTFIASGSVYIFSVAIAILFIIMYAVNRKELIY